MALIQCPECNNPVSDTAAACPHCGAPVVPPRGGRGDDDETPVITVELTRKRFKARLIYASVLWWAGFIWCLVVLNNGKFLSQWSVPGLVLLAVGFGWYLATRIQIWWHHR